MIVSRDGWVKRQKEVRDLSTTRLREGDSVLAVAAGKHARDASCSSRNFGAAYTSRIIDVPASTGYGEPVQKLFKLRDGERIVAAFSLDPRVAGNIATRKEGEAPPVHAIAVTSDGYSLRFSFEPFVEPSTRAGRRYARPSEGVEVVGVARVTGEEVVIAATADARALLCRADEVNYLSGPGKGVILIKLTARGRSRARLHRVHRRSRPDARRNEPRQRADDQHGEIRGHRPGRQRARIAPAGPVHADHLRTTSKIPAARRRYVEYALRLTALFARRDPECRPPR